MAKFVYTVQDTQGNASTGMLEASDEDQAVIALQNKGLFVLSIQPESESKGAPVFRKFKSGGRISGQELAFFSEQVSTLLAGGVPLVRSLSLLSDYGTNRALAAVVGDIAKEVAAGGALYKALEKHPQTFDSIWVSLVQAGEMGGQLPGALRQVSQYIQSKETIRNKIITAVAYPVVLFTMSIGVLAYFIIYIVPVFASIFRDFNMKLPILTQTIVDFSYIVTHYYVAIIVVITGAILAIRSYLATEVGRLTWHQTQLKLPLFGEFIRNVLLERLLTTMSTLIKSGVSILNTISVLEGAFANNLVIQKALKSVKNDVASGKSISASFKNTGIFPGLVTEMMWMGEESGKLPDIINTLSSYYIEQINQFIARFSALIDPVLVVGIGGIIGVIVISIFLPIFQLSQISTKG
ncbi:MAG: type II secretion system F family protein [Elusimicrobiales bacterium]|nr:type II secretion system F family protein [Elusimicrobiales bacterium]